jgi:two-component system, NtrC family, response regulator AtoC
MSEAQLAIVDVDRSRTYISDDSDSARVYWGTGQAMRRVLTMIDRVADSDVSVLLSGESGVGKEVVARELHRRSARRPYAFVKINCAALPADLLESELFGHERGAFTGAQQARVGKFEFATDSTLMLDEIGEMPLALQAKMLHVLQDGEFARLGSNRPVSVDVRVIAATNRDLAEMIRLGTFREDLYYRLQVIEIRVPPLRERPDEILPLAEFFLRRDATRYSRPTPRLSSALTEMLRNYAWPGNIRELENLMKRFVILQDEALVQSALARTGPSPDQKPEIAPAPPPATRPAPMRTAPAENDGAAGSRAHPDSDTVTLPDLSRRAALTAERDAIRDTLDRVRWNRRKAAERLGVSYKTLLNRMKECGIGGPAVAKSEP